MTWGETIKYFRKHNGWSRRELCEAAGVSHTALVSWENDEHLPDIQKFSVLMAAMGVQGTIGATSNYAPFRFNKTIRTINPKPLEKYQEQW